MKLISACLCGYNCRYNGGNNSHPVFIELVKTQEFIPVCPEEMGGLPTPRSPAEICNGSGNDVLAGKCKVINKDGHDVTEFFVKGAYSTLIKAKEVNATCAILKSRSPSCGVHSIYDGSFSSSLRAGEGVTTALLRKHGIQVISDEDYLKGE